MKCAQNICYLWLHQQNKFYVDETLQKKYFSSNNDYRVLCKKFVYNVLWG